MNIKYQKIIQNLESDFSTLLFYTLAPEYPHFYISDVAHYILNHMGAGSLFPVLAEAQKESEILRYQKFQESQLWKVEMSKLGCQAVCRCKKGEEIFRIKNLKFTNPYLDSFDFCIAYLCGNSEKNNTPQRWVTYLPDEY